MNQSLSFASLIQKQFEQGAGRFNRGVKQAGFLVLFKTAMPSILIELGFLTNKSDEKFLSGEKGQDNMANSILKAFKEYKSDTERRASGSLRVENQDDIDKTNSDKKTSPMEDKKDLEPDKVALNDDNQSVNDSSGSDDAASHELGRVFYTIQVGAIANATSGEDTRFDKVKDVRKLIGDDGMTRFYSGIYNDIDLARKSLQSLKQLGYKDAFIAAFEGAKRISVTEAGQLLKRK